MGINSAEAFFFLRKQEEAIYTHICILDLPISFSGKGSSGAELGVRQVEVFPLLHLLPERGGNGCLCSPRDQGERVCLSHKISEELHQRVDSDQMLASWISRVLRADIFQEWASEGRLWREDFCISIGQ